MRKSCLPGSVPAPASGLRVRLVVFERCVQGDPPGRRGRRGTEHGSMGAAALGFETLEGVAHGQRRLGAWLDAGDHADTIVDLNRALAVKLAADDAGAPEAEADSLLPAEIALYLRRLPDSLHAARAALAFVERSLDAYDAPDLAAAGVVLPRRAVRLAAPVQHPGKVVGVLRGDDGSEPALFLVAPSAVAGPEDDLSLPAGATLSFGPQLAAVVGRRLRRVAPERALEGVAGYTAALAFRSEGGDAPPGPIRHSGDGFLRLGPALVTADEAPDPHDLKARLRLSGRTLQSVHTKELPLPMHELVARASQAMTLEPGDVVLSGAPLAASLDPPALRDGDVVEAEMERLGKLSVYLRA